MKPWLFIPIAVVACPVIVILLILGWKASWTGGHPATWILASTALSAACVFGVPRLKQNASVSSAVVDKLVAALVAIGFLWTFFLFMAERADAGLKRPGIVTAVENGRAHVSFSPYPGKSFTYDFPASGGFYHLNIGDSTEVLWSKHVMLAVEKRGFLILGFVNALLLVLGGLFAGGRFRLKSRQRRVSFPDAENAVIPDKCKP
jgi:hypothetical protein